MTQHQTRHRTQRADCCHNISQAQETPQDTTGLRRSQRQRRPTQRYIAEALAAELSVEQGPYDIAFEVLAVPNNEAENENMNPLFAMAASADPDTMYWHEAMQQPDRKQFLEAAVKEVNDQTKNGNWEVVHRTQVPSDAAILPAVWSLRRKRRIKTHEVYKWKAQLNIDGSKQQKGINFWESYAAVCTWAAIRLILILVILNKWKTRQIDFVQAYPQAPVEVDNLYMKIPRGFEIEGAAKDEYLLHIRRNIYGQVQAGRVWNKCLVGKLIDISNAAWWTKVSFSVAMSFTRCTPTIPFLQAQTMQNLTKSYKICGQQALNLPKKVI